jgi:hypothetical protein
VYIIAQDIPFSCSPKKMSIVHNAVLISTKSIILSFSYFDKHKTLVRKNVWKINCIARLKIIVDANKINCNQVSDCYMNVNVFRYVFIYSLVYVYISIWWSTCLCIYRDENLCKYNNVYIYIYTYMHICMYVYTCICVYIYQYIYVYLYPYLL